MLKQEVSAIQDQFAIFPDFIEEQETWVDDYHQQYLARKEEAEKTEAKRIAEEEEQKRKEEKIRVQNQLSETISTYKDLLRELQPFAATDPKSAEDLQQLENLITAHQEEPPLVQLEQLSSFPLQYDSALRESQERKEKKDREEQQKRKKEEAIKQKKMDILLNKNPSNLRQALAIIHFVYDLTDASSKKELYTYFQEKLPSTDPKQLSLINSLCYESNILHWMREDKHQQINLAVHALEKDHDPYAIKNTIQLLCSILSYTEPEFTTYTQQSKKTIPQQDAPFYIQPKIGMTKKNRYYFRRKPNSKTYHFHADPNHCTATIIGYFFCHKIFPVRMDLHGQLIGWYRFSQDGTNISGSTPLSKISSLSPLDLCFVPNTAITVNVEVPSCQLKTQTVIGSAVPFMSLLDIFGNWFGLPKKEWTIYIDGQETGYYNILSDFTQENTPTIKLC